MSFQETGSWHDYAAGIFVFFLLFFSGASVILYGRYDLGFLLLFAGGDPDHTVQPGNRAGKRTRCAGSADGWRGLQRKGSWNRQARFLKTGNVVFWHGAAECVKRLEDFSGYAILSVLSEKEAVEIAGSAPHVVFGGTTVVRPCLGIPG